MLPWCRSLPLKRLGSCAPTKVLVCRLFELGLGHASYQAVRRMLQPADPPLLSVSPGKSAVGVDTQHVE